MKQVTSICRKSAAKASSGISRRITLTANPHPRHRLYWYTHRLSDWGSPMSSISEKQHGPERGGEMMKFGYRFWGG
ncbi:MAG: hypothetical protein LUO89_03455 [Methanothrix sp.]|nr:hypothetical protein [Methanothrix sp.]